jgi:hypothetical protein
MYCRKEGDEMSKLLSGLVFVILIAIVADNASALNQLFDVIGELLKFGFVLIKAVFDLVFGIFKAIL